MESQGNVTYENADSYAITNTSKNTRGALSDADAETIANLVLKEHPQTIAVVLSRLEHDRAAEVLSQLPTELQVEVLSRLVDLDTTDPHTLHVVESQLAEWINTQQKQKKRMVAGTNLVQRILSNSPQREAILTKINRRNPELASCLQLDSASENMGLTENSVGNPPLCRSAANRAHVTPQRAVPYGNQS